MKPYLFIPVLIFLCVNHAHSQSPDTLWTAVYGGSAKDIAYSISETNDHKLLVAGYTQSNDGDVTGFNGENDYWILKLDDNGDSLWTKTFGGTKDDRAYDIYQNYEGNYFVTGSARSKDGDIVGSHGSSEYWALKLDEAGDTLWTRCFGGNFFERSYQSVQTPDSGYIFAGYTVDNSFPDTALHRESRDYWILKTDKNGDSIWSRILGGEGYDIARSVAITFDSGYIAAGYSRSNNIDVHGNHGSYDFWLVKFNYYGDTLWTKCYGGGNRDEAYVIRPTIDSAYIVAGGASSNNDDVHGNHGGYDFWIIKINTDGDTLWTRTYGGSGNEMAFDIFQTADSGYLVAGYTESTDGDININKGLSDYWIIKLNADGDSLWTKTLGGSARDSAFSVFETMDGSIFVAGSSGSNDGDVKTNHGGSDYWIIKLGVTPPALVQQQINLQAGWNIVSFNVTPDTLDLLDILSPLIDSGYLIKVIDESGEFIQNITGLGWINTIGDMANTEGYYIKLSNSTSFEISGLPVVCPFNIDLSNGWNIMGYPLNSEQSGLSVIQPLIDSGTLIKVIDEEGGFIQEIPEFGWLNTIGNFTPGEGYYLKVSSSPTLTLAEEDPLNKMAEKTVFAPSHSNDHPHGNSYHPMNIIIENIIGINLETGDEIAVYDGETRVCSAKIIDTTDRIILVAYEDDPETEIKDGYTRGNILSFKVSGKNTQKVNRSVNPKFISGDPFFEPLGTWTGELTFKAATGGEEQPFR